MQYMIGFVIFIILLILINANPPGYMGCYESDVDFRYTRRFMNPNGAKYCTIFCVRKGHRYAGLTPDDCFCGNMMPKRRLIELCNVPCTGNEVETCGSYGGSISIYDTCHLRVPTTRNPTSTTGPHPTSDLCVPTTRNATSTTGPQPTSDDDATETVSVTTMTSTTIVDNKETGRDQQHAVTIYVPIACGVIVIAIIVIVLVLTYRRIKNKACEDKTETLESVEYTNQPVNDGGHMYSNENVETTHGGQYMNTKIQANEPTIYENDGRDIAPSLGIYTGLDFDTSTSQTYEQLSHT